MPAREGTPGTPGAVSAEVDFEVERFAWEGGRLELEGRWFGLRGRRFVRPVLVLRGGGRRRRLIALMEHKPWAPVEGEPWVAAFSWTGEIGEVEGAELAVGPTLAVELPAPAGAGGRFTAGGRLRAAAPERRERATPSTEIRPEAVRLRELARERDRALAARDEALAEQARLASARERTLRERADTAIGRDQAVRAREAAVTERDQAAAERDSAQAELRRALTDRDEARRERADAQARIDELMRERDALQGQRGDALRERDVLAEQRDAAMRERDEAAAEHRSTVGQRDRALAERKYAINQRDRTRRALDAARRGQPVSGTDADVIPAGPDVIPAEAGAPAGAVSSAAEQEPADSRAADQPRMRPVRTIGGARPEGQCDSGPAPRPKPLLQPVTAPRRARISRRHRRRSTARIAAGIALMVMLAVLLVALL